MKGLESACELLLKSKAKHFPPKQSVKFKNHIWSKITKKFANKCLDVSRLQHITDNTTAPSSVIYASIINLIALVTGSKYKM